MRGLPRLIMGLVFLILMLAASKFILRKTQFASFAEMY